MKSRLVLVLELLPRDFPQPESAATPTITGVSFRAGPKYRSRLEVIVGWVSA